MDAYEVLVLRYRDVAFRTAYLITGQAGEAEEAAQEAFVKAYYALARFRAGAAFRPWLLRIVANEARNRRKATGRRAQLAWRAALPRELEAPEAAAVVAEERQALLAAVNALREEERLAVACRYFLDLSEEEIAAALGCARGTVKSRLSRALGRLRHALAQALAAEPAGRTGAGARDDG